MSTSNILLVDDNPVTRKVVGLTLRVEGYRVLEAADGREALAHMAQDLPDLILLDLVLPDINGVDLLKRLRAVPGGADLPVLAFSGFISKMDEARVAGAGFTDFVPKPVEPSRLLTIVKSFIARQSADASPAGLNRGLLLVDDDPVQLRLYRLQFEQAGFRVRVANHGAEALAKAQAEPPDVIVSDVLMPHLDGFELCLAMRHEDRLRRVPLILVTSNYVEDEDRKLAERVGASGFVYRNPGFDVVLNAVLDGLAKPVPGPAAAPAELETERHARIVRQLERQVSLHNACVQRHVIQSAILHELGTIADTLAKCQDLEGALDATLAYCLDGAGLSKGALYLVDADDRLLLHAQYGCSPVLGPARALFGVPGLFYRVLKTGAALMIPSAELESAQSDSLLGQAQSQSALMIPVQAGGKDVAVLLLLSLHRDLLEEDWFAFGRALAAQIGQSLALSRAFYRLAAAEKKLSGILASIDNVVWSISVPEMQLLYMSPVAERIYGRPAGDFFENQRLWFELILREDRPHVTGGMAELLESGSFTFRYRIRHAGGEVRWLEDRATAVPDEAGRIVRLDGVVSDITESKDNERRITRLSRIHALLSGINSLIVRTRDRDRLFHEACRIAVTEGGFRMAWIGVIDPETLDGKVVAWFGGEAGATDMIRLTARADTPYSERPACRAVRELRTVTCNDVRRDPGLALIKDELYCGGRRAVACFPLIVGQRVAAVLTLYAGEAGFFDEQEIKLLEELSGDIAFGVEHIEKEERLNYLSYYDSLTGLPNRLLFRDRLTQLLHRVGPENGQLAVLIIDVERFRNINESLGRQAGDEVLKLVAQRLGEVLQDKNQLARLGSDGFAAMILDVQIEADIVHFVHRRILDALLHPLTVGGVELGIPARFGIALFPNDGADADELLLNAETALKRAKVAGERYLFYAPQMHARVGERLTLENKLRRALEEKQFVLHYQPKVHSISGRIAGMEALIRWQNPELGLVPPGEFIPLLEETGMILEAGQWVMEKVAADRRDLLAKGLPPPPIAVNVSALQLRRKEFVEEIARAFEIDERGSGFELEVTETLLMEDIEGAIEKLKRVREMGFGVALDDFGTGYSSLSYLVKLPIDSLKIDRSFIVDIASSAEHRAIISTVTSLAHSLKLRVVAEGVETEEQVGQLRLLACDEMQGYFFSRPVPLQQIEAMLHTGGSDA